MSSTTQAALELRFKGYTTSSSASSDLSSSKHISSFTNITSASPHTIQVWHDSHENVDTNLIAKIIAEFLSIGKWKNLTLEFKNVWKQYFFTSIASVLTVTGKASPSSAPTTTAALPSHPLISTPSRSLTPQEAILLLRIAETISYPLLSKEIVKDMASAILAKAGNNATNNAASSSTEEKKSRHELSQFLFKEYVQFMEAPLLVKLRSELLATLKGKTVQEQSAAYSIIEILSVYIVMRHVDSFGPDSFRFSDCAQYWSQIQLTPFTEESLTARIKNSKQSFEFNNIVNYCGQTIFTASLAQALATKKPATPAPAAVGTANGNAKPTSSSKERYAPIPQEIEPDIHTTSITSLNEEKFPVLRYRTYDSEGRYTEHVLVMIYFDTEKIIDTPYEYLGINDLIERSPLLFASLTLHHVVRSLPPQQTIPSTTTTSIEGRHPSNSNVRYRIHFDVFEEDEKKLKQAIREKELTTSEVAEIQFAPFEELNGIDLVSALLGSSKKTEVAPSTSAFPLLPPPVFKKK